MTTLKLNFIIRQGQILNIQLLSNRRIRQVYTKNCISTIIYIERIQSIGLKIHPTARCVTLKLCKCPTKTM